MYRALLIIYLLVALSIIVLVLMQQGKGAELGAASGMGASGTLFGATGSSRFMCQLTAILMGLFFALCLLLGNVTRSRATKGPWQALGEPTLPATSVPAAPEISH